MATNRFPIVFYGAGDPIGLGLIQSFARPGGNITGVTDLDLELDSGDGRAAGGAGAAKGTEPIGLSVFNASVRVQRPHGRWPVGVAGEPERAGRESKVLSNRLLHSCLGQAVIGILLKNPKNASTGSA